ncbi:single-stranded DNA-binding protein [Candidatus Hydrogenedentota bacterium]
MADLRMPNINNVMIAGRLTRDPELKYIPSGTAVMNFSVASSRFYTGNDGQKKEDTTFVDCQVWDKTAEYWSDKLGKGRPVLVEGNLRSRSWETNEGQKRTKVEINVRRLHVLDWPADSSGGPRGGQTQQNQQNAGPGGDFSEDDIPF